MSLANLRLLQGKSFAPAPRMRRRGSAALLAALVVGLLGPSSDAGPTAGAAEFGPRPAFAVLDARLATWDADAGPDGWVAAVQVCDAAGRPLRFSGNASFQLTPRVPSADLTSFVAVPGQRLRWTTKLTTDEDGCATFRLPLRRSLPRTATGDVPFSGVLRVRVVVPTAGVYEAESAVAINPPALVNRLRPSGLVDTLWNAR